MKVGRLVLAILVIAVATFAPAQSDPRLATISLYVAIHKQDWRQLYSMIAFSPKVQKGLKGPDKFAKDVNDGIGKGKGRKTIDTLFAHMRNMRVGDANLAGDKAVVATSVDIISKAKSQHLVGSAHMIRIGGVWKWDLTSSDNIGPLIAKSLLELIGRPGPGQ